MLCHGTNLRQKKVLQSPGDVDYCRHWHWSTSKPLSCHTEKWFESTKYRGRADPELCQLLAIRVSACRVVASAQLFVLSNEALYYVDPRLLQAAVPQHLRGEHHHGGLFGGHFSGDRLLKTTSCKWWWRRMYKDFVEHTKNCPDCSFVDGGG